MGRDLKKIRLPKIEVPEHRRALGEALRKEYASRAGAPGRRRLPIAGKGWKIAIPAAGLIVMGLVVILVFSLVGSPTGGEPGLPVLSESQALAARVEAHTEGFDFALFKEVTQKDGANNIVLSPLSARVALAMAYNGAGDEVAKDMAQVLDFEGMSLEQVNAMMRNKLVSLQGADPALELEIANSVWSDDGVDFKADFRQRCVESYDAEVASVDFDGEEAAGIIDGWVDEKTHGKIPKITDEFDLPGTVAMLINALYMKGSWAAQFDAAMTVNRDFHLVGGATVQVPMMNQAGSYSYYENPDFQAVSLPYQGGRLSMYVFLPREGKSLDDFVASLNRDNWEGWMTLFSVRAGQIALPRFKMDYEKNLNTTLASLGMGSAFVGGAFPKMTDEDPLWIHKVIQKTYLDVNEEGTEATAATAINMTKGMSSPQEQPFVMEVDRPFFFAIRDNRTGTLLFMGSILDPRG
jgi:serine protease inhibitor